MEVCKSLQDFKGSHAKVKIWGSLFFEINVHVINENLYFAIGVETMLQKNVHGAIIERKKYIFNSNALIFCLLNHGCPMIEYFAMQIFFCATKCF